MAGIAWTWIGVGFSKPSFFRMFNSLVETPHWAQVFIGFGQPLPENLISCLLNLLRKCIHNTCLMSREEDQRYHGVSGLKICVMLFLCISFQFIQLVFFFATRDREIGSFPYH